MMHLAASPKCIENKTTMSNVLKEYMKEYIEC